MDNRIWVRYSKYKIRRGGDSITQYYYPIPLIANFLHLLSWFMVMNHTYPRRYSKTVTYLTELALFAVYVYLGSTLPFMSLIRAFYVPFLFTAVFALLFRERWQRLFFTVMILFLIMVLSELLCALFVYTPEEMSGKFTDQPPMRQLQTYALTLPVSWGMAWLLYLFLNRSKKLLSLKQWMLCVVFLMSQLLIIFGYMQKMSEAGSSHHALYATIALLSSIVADGFVVAYVMTTTQREVLQKENQLISHQIDEQLRRYASITAEYEAVRRMRHDIAKHLNTMEALLNQGETAEARQYISELHKNNFIPSPQICENPVVDALLNYYRSQTALSKPSLDMRVSIPAHPGVQNSDLICVFGNLLDNALAACTSDADAHILLEAVFMKGCLVISIENPIGKPEKDRVHIPYLDRGVGTKVLNQIAKKYGGSYIAKEENGRFSGQVTLMAQEDLNDNDCDM